MQNAFLLELLITTCLLVTIIQTEISISAGNIEKQHQILVAQRFDFILQLAKSHAIAKQSTTSICPSTDGKTCHHNWATGILIYCKHNPIQWYPNKTNMNISLHAFSSDGQKLSILSSGHTHQNGHFEISTAKPVGNNRVLLVFNESLRTYLNIHGPIKKS